MSNSLYKVSTFKELFSLIFELRLNKAFVAFVDKSSEACFRLPVKMCLLLDIDNYMYILAQLMCCYILYQY